jgi:hypothetical protein
MSMIDYTGREVVGWRYAIGLDLGRQSDPSALALLKWPRYQLPRLGRGEAPPNIQPSYEVPTLHRWPLQTPYVTIAREVASFMRKPPLAGEYCLLVVDATGVGSPVCEMLGQEIANSGAGINAGMVRVTITAGSAITQVGEGAFNVAKKQLVSTLQVLLGSQRLKVAADHPEAKTLMRELGTFTVKVTSAANETFESWRERDHDDLVLAVALAAWGAEYLPHPDDAPVSVLGNQQ